MPGMVRRRELLYRFAGVVVPAVIRFWVRLEYRGIEHIPRQGPVIIAANHISYFDPLCLAVLVHDAGRKVRFLAKAELFRVPILRQILLGLGQIPVHREHRDASKALSRAVEALKEQGAAVIIYPEGTTTTNPDCSPGPPKSGVARLAALTGAPVVPVGIWGAHVYFRRGRIGPFRRGARVVLDVGPPIHLGLAPGAPLAEINAARDRVMAAVIERYQRARAGWEPPRWYRAPAEPGAGQRAGA